MAGKPGFRFVVIATVGVAAGIAEFLSIGLVGGGDGIYLPFLLIGSPIFVPFLVPLMWAVMTAFALSSSSRQRRLIVGAFLMIHYAVICYFWFFSDSIRGVSLSRAFRIVPGSVASFFLLYLVMIVLLWWAALARSRFHPAYVICGCEQDNGA